MTEEEWRSTAWRTLDQLAGEGLSGTRGLARALVTVAMLMETAPRPTVRRDGYVAVGKLKVLTERAKARVLRDDFSAPRADESVPELFAVLASQLAALDDVNHKLVGDLAPAVPSEDWFTEYVGGEAFLIPRGGQHRTSETAPPKNGQLTIKWRDLMPHHRVLPTHLEDVAIEPHWRDMRGAWPKGAGLAAGFFTGLSFQDDLPGPDFLVTGVTCEGQEDQISALVAEGHDAQCAALVLPELTMPLERVAMLQDFLRQRMQWAELKEISAPGLIVAGSWHAPTADGAGFANVAPVFDAYGEPILQHAKLLTFSFNGSPERIVVGDKLHVLVTEDVLIGFGICLDFCDRQEGTVFPFLDVDYALVPSCGADVTMQGHIDTTRDMMTRFRSRAFVVQHLYPAAKAIEGSAPLGYVLPPRDVEGLTPANTLVTDAFSLHPTD